MVSRVLTRKLCDLELLKYYSRHALDQQLRRIAVVWAVTMNRRDCMNKYLKTPRFQMSIQMSLARGVLRFSIYTQRFRTFNNDKAMYLAYKMRSFR
jgi:hypothetical protein